MSDRELYCDTCEGVVLFEALPCLDDGEPEWSQLACTGCGSALLVAAFAAHAPRLDRRRRPAHRRAA
ncbi:hypothetical protein GA0074695_1956 [Micromonospora viridifaciens]|uniref:Uncharacterized protein n=1 Tax=Micromonospora viridifaciens TaxID=1881 RepID=A0A1C4VZT5_MICVI|nr:hypothetical protein [Micromonospora viridifaciens]SCE89375.1 hypothetical protein GA0074695_1956 [Micromonospora viridifaciens]